MESAEGASLPETIIVAGPGDISDAHAQRYAAKCADVIVADTALGEREREREREEFHARRKRRIGEIADVAAADSISLERKD